MAKVGEFYIATEKDPAWQKDRYAVRERIGTEAGAWRRIASCNSHWNAVRILKAMTEEAKRDPLFTIDVNQMHEEVYKERLSAHAWQLAAAHLVKELEEEKAAEQEARERAHKYISRRFVAAKLTIQTPRGATILTKDGAGMQLCAHKGGDDGLTITIE